MYQSIRGANASLSYRDIGAYKQRVLHKLMKFGKK